MEKIADEKPKKWLQRLKEESWEAELLISTVAIFATLKLFEVLNWGINSMIDILPPSQYEIGFLIGFVSYFAVSIMATMFIVHFILRSYWVGLVGLNSVFPDYSVEDSAYSEIYTKKVLSSLPPLKTTIQDVDELSSVIFSAAFSLLLAYAYMSLAFGLYLLCYNFLSGYVNNYILLIPIGVLLLLLMGACILWFMSLFKKYREHEKIQLFYFKCGEWLGKLLCGPTYKYVMQISMTFASNYKKKKSLILITFMIAMLGGIFWSFGTPDKLDYLLNQDYIFDSTRTHSDFYASGEDEKSFLITPQIDSDVVDSKILRLFIPILRYERRSMKEWCGKFVKNEKSTKKKQKKAKGEWHLKCYTEYNQVFLNGEKISARFIKYQIPETNQFGILTYLDLEDQKMGYNELKIVKKLDKNPMEWTIPFQYIQKN